MTTGLLISVDRSSYSARMAGNTRDRFLVTAADRFQRAGLPRDRAQPGRRRGKAPKGSLYFHFSGGKEQLAAEAVMRGGPRPRALNHCLLVEADHGLVLVETGFGPWTSPSPTSRSGQNSSPASSRCSLRRRRPSNGCCSAGRPRRRHRHRADPPGPRPLRRAAPTSRPRPSTCTTPSTAPPWPPPARIPSTRCGTGLRTGRTGRAGPPTRPGATPPGSGSTRSASTDSPTTCCWYRSPGTPPAAAHGQPRPVARADPLARRRSAGVLRTRPVGVRRARGRGRQRAASRSRRVSRPI